jgi:hypothetical protein
MYLLEEIMLLFPDRSEVEKEPNRTIYSLLDLLRFTLQH